MIVYGDPQVSHPAAFVLNVLGSRVQSLRPGDIEGLRSCLVLAGALEQAVEDGSPAIPEFTRVQVRALTEVIAAGFCSAFRETSVAGCPDVTRTTAEILKRLQLPSGLYLTIKAPEGFEFYALFPEQYSAAAERWAKKHQSGARILVVGLRSIGTTLSAVVSATLDQLGFETTRTTLRPNGHPFSRSVQIDLSPLKYQHALVVDEGPGISGSSMAAVAQALNEQSIRSICFLPGHDNGPGPAADPHIAEIWNRTPRIVLPLSDVRWDGLSLSESLCERTTRGVRRHIPDLDPAAQFVHDHALNLLFGESSHGAGSATPIQDCSGGLWRQLAFISEGAWPPVATQFERMKFRCFDSSGKPVLWKFAGLGSVPETGVSAAWTKLNALAAKGFTTKPLMHFRGFIAMPWIEGLRLTIADAIDPHVQERIGEYIVAASDPPLSESENAEAVNRLAEMLYWNTKEALGEAAAEETKRWSRAVEINPATLKAGDGRMAPHEWLQTGAEEILKFDCEGHSIDHTMPGPQPIYWDIAGALVEWNLAVDSSAALLEPLRQMDITVSNRTLHFYLMAYAAFRMGLMSLAQSQTSDSSERSRLKSGFYFYENQLIHLLKVEAAAIPISR